jgi:hypothetical protein
MGEKMWLNRRQGLTTTEQLGLENGALDTKQRRAWSTPSNCCLTGDQDTGKCMSEDGTFVDLNEDKH